MLLERVGHVSDLDESGIAENQWAGFLASNIVLCDLVHWT